MLKSTGYDRCLGYAQLRHISDRLALKPPYTFIMARTKQPARRSRPFRSQGQMRVHVSDSESSLDSSLDSEPSTKRAKGKGRAKDTPSLDLSSMEDIHKPTSTGWNDMPEWEDGMESPLMKVPGEIMDKIFCVRPELGVCPKSRVS
jgi:hypothetical protein